MNSISVVDSIKEHGTTAAGAYYNDSHSIKIMKKAIEKKPISELITYSRSDDHELHFFAHEYGHYIADSLEHNQLSTDSKIVQESLLRYFDGDIFKTKTSNLVKELGSYGSRNAQEAFAEAFAEAYTCKEPGRFAKIFREELEKILDITQNGSAPKLLEKNPASGIMKLPKAEKCVIPKAKFTEYALNPAKDPDKAEAFRKALGYTSENADELITQIQSKISSYEAVERGDNGYGMTYQVVMDIDGPNGKRAKVLTAWIDDREKGETRLTTVHID